MQSELIERYAKPVPRYTSYPTAPHFTPDIDASAYRSWLEAITPGTPVSLYAHIPFCDRLCWFCGCTTKQVQRYDPVEVYLDSLRAEIAHAGDAVTREAFVTAMHFGGGSPTMLKADDIRLLGETLRGHFAFSPDAEISVEMDPNDMTEDRFDAYAAIGMTRASLGVQDFDPAVQKAINREQTVEQTRSVVDGVRRRGVNSVNLDILYGLPHQTVESIERTVRACIAMEPDRIALFGYAHVPWMKKHQTMIDETVLPGLVERFRQQDHAAALLREAGYIAIGFDHFARPSDSMAKALQDGTLKRNFQGYTTDDAPVLIGLGASAIGQLPQGYVQNSPASGDYQRRIANDGFATVRGVRLNGDDVMRRAVIEKLMCDFAFSREWVLDTFGASARAIIDEADDLVASDRDGLFARDGATYRVTETGRPFVRVIAAHFDAYLHKGAARHSAAV
ncbi:MAG: oxygen-independent coproporphyrinogen III oxidase [Phyllobacteriaceae bacterium]|nr:oxygen-independent coproporphyrinogen III oxidase [Phyllobacteriaceae bacterium]MBA91032.1 oxygen-independent coproporphyrinogen III oxidase [Phyllobacteriaceae bacterium]